MPPEKTPTESSSPLVGARLRYLFLTVWDLAAMVAFYRDALGFEVEFEQRDHVVFLRFGEGGQSLALHAGRDGEAPADTSADPPAQHWFSVLDVDDLDVAVTALRTRGVEVGDPFEVPYGRAAKLRDPEGHVLELHQPA